VGSSRTRSKTPMHIAVPAEFKMFGVTKKQGAWYVAHCPALDITTQGRTEDEAKKNLIEASELFVISCFERGTFEQALRELGWRVLAGKVVRAGKSASPTLPPRGFHFPVPVPFGLEQAAKCHA